jgi:hypothetical protein
MENADKHGTNTSGSDVVAEAIAYKKKAEELRSAAIEQLLAEHARIEANLKTLGFAWNGRTKQSQHGTQGGKSSGETGQSKRFKDLKLADVARILIQESNDGQLHGSEIERLSRVGGFKGGTANFQNYLPVALKRDGGFVNIGGNTWRLTQ